MWKYKLSWTVYSERGSSLEGSWVEAGSGGGGSGGEEDLRELTRRLRSALPRGDLNCYTVKRFFTWRLRFSAQDIERTFADTNSPIPVYTWHVSSTYWHVSWVSLQIQPPPTSLLSARSILRVVPHFFSGIVEPAKLERAWKSPHARKGDTPRGERKMRGDVSKEARRDICICRPLLRL